ncbi:WD repeat-containing protein WRAP73-like [Venturia canescens]|uniref:WD repeat-containing protein WRAP73-like n=1 Tax=Venturia canescens TaxID=32260 RepID=UPI001C9C4178|nr:WD repeat-containing protein WRAP73-like [Venturia canescens]
MYEKPRKMSKQMDIMEGSESESSIFRVNNNLCEFSPCGDFFAIAYQSNLIIKRSGIFDTTNSYELDDVIEYIEWSPNSQYILCANIKKCVIRVFSIFYPEWKCKFVEGSAGMEKVMWSPDGNHIISFAELKIQISIWSLENQSITNIQNLKSLTDTNVLFSPNGKNLAVITTDNGTDSIEIYKTKGWKISRKLLCEKLSAIDGLCWSPNSELLCMWCSISGQTKLLVYSTTTESHVGVFCPEVSKTKIDGAIRDNYQGPRGIDRVSWNPSGQLLAIAAFNETIVLLNYVTWKPILDLRCNPVITECDYLGRIYRELEKRDSNVNLAQGETHKMEEVMERPINIPIGTNFKGSGDGPFIARIDIFEFSCCGRYLAFRHQVYSSTLWIWDIAEDSVDYVMLKRPISGICWSPNSPRLMIFNESPQFFEWSASRKATGHSSPRGITVLSGRWHPRGKMLSLGGYNKTAIMRFTE